MLKIHTILNDSNVRNPHIIDVKQGSDEWLALRKTKITATDASIIMGVNPWKSKRQLYNEKISNVNPLYMNEKMQRGLDLEPIARDLFTITTGIPVTPAVVVKDWAMASLDGMSDDGKVIVEIKCAGEKDHFFAVYGKIPPHYYPQLQHQMYVCGLNEMYYASFDGTDSAIVEVKRDDEYIAKMLQEELKFFHCLQSKTPPENSENEYNLREDYLWEMYASQWKEVTQKIKDLEIQEQELKNELIYLSGQSNTKGGGISLCQIQRKGNVDYSKIPELKNVDLDLYRKQTSSSWRIQSI